MVGGVAYDYVHEELRGGLAQCGLDLQIMHRIHSRRSLHGKHAMQKAA